jgi:hypothetical protein
MALVANEKYVARVKDAFITKSDTGTAGLFMSYDTDSGSIDHTWHITDKTFERLMDNLGKCFGITEAQLLDNSFLDKIGDSVHGKECRIETEDHEYNGKHYVRIKWMNPIGFVPKKSSGAELSRVAGIFGGKRDAPAADFEGISDESAPF